MKFQLFLIFFNFAGNQHFGLCHSFLSAGFIFFTPAGGIWTTAAHPLPIRTLFENNTYIKQERCCLT